MTGLASVRTKKDFGIEGDRYCDGSGFWQTVVKPRKTIRDVSIIRASDILNSGFSETETRRNIILETDLNLNDLLSSKFLIGSILFEAHEECTPCKRPSDLSGKEGFAQKFKHTGGIRAKVLTTGILNVGDSVSILK